MNTPSTAVLEAAAGSQETPPPAMSPTRPMYWSVRRELWENRSIYLAPLAAAAVFLFGFLIGTIHLPQRMSTLAGSANQRAAVVMPYNTVAGLIAVTAFLVGVFYCLDALHGERRDRSILFWKSLPVSDRTTVLSKLSIPLLVMPPFIFAVIIATQVVMLLLSTMRLLSHREALVSLWTNVTPFQSSIALLYGLIAIALWHAPLYGWLLLISAWARRATFLWAVLPLLGISMFEWIAFRTTYFGHLLQYRLTGWYTQAFVPRAMSSVPIDPLPALTPGNFLSTPGLWIGLIFAAAFVAGAVRLRRNREPI